MKMKQVWCEKYRPKTVADIILTNAHEARTFAKYVEEGEFPNLLLHGGSGTGKSTMSLALIRDVQVERTDVLKVNCSDEKIDAIREKVKVFAMTMAMGKFKVVRLEEFDYLSHDAQALLRDLIETTSSNCRFIATCNYPNRLLPAIRSRFQEVALTAPLKDDVLMRSAEILELEGVEFELDDLEKVVESAYPDFRKVLQKLEQSSKTGVLVIASAENAADWKLGLLPLLEADNLQGARKLVCEQATKEELVEVYRFLYGNLHRVKSLKAQDEAIILLAQYQYQHAFVADPELQIAALFIEIMNLM